MTEIDRRHRHHRRRRCRMRHLPPFRHGGLRPLLLETGDDIPPAPARANSAASHPASTPPGSLGARLHAAGYREYMEIRERLNLHVVRSAPWSSPGTTSRWRSCRRSPPRQLEQRTGCPPDRPRRATPPRATAFAKALGAVLVPGEHIIDPGRRRSLMCIRGSPMAAGAPSMPRDRWRYDGIWTPPPPRA